MIKNGVAKFSATNKHKFADGTRLYSGLSLKFQQECMKMFDEDLYSKCDLTKYYYTEQPERVHTVRKRNAIDAINAGLFYHWNNQMNEGHSYFHHSTVKAEDIMTYSNDCIYDLPLSVGDNFVLCKKQLLSMLTGDGGSNAKRSRTKNITAGLYKYCPWKNDISDILQAAIPLLLSELNEKSYFVRKHWQIIIKQVGKKFIAKIWDIRSNCYALIQVIVFHSGDWPWITTTTISVVHHQSDYQLSFLAFYFKGVAYGIKWNQRYWALMYGITENKDLPPIEERHNENFTALVVHDTPTMQMQGGGVDVIIEYMKEKDLEDGNEERWNERGYEHTKRKNIAQKTLAHGILSAKNLEYLWVVWDPLHAQLAFSRNWIQTLTRIQLSVWHFRPIDVYWTWKQMNITSLCDEIGIWILKNKNAETVSNMKVNTTGLISINVINSFTKVLVANAKMAERYEYVRRDDTEQATISIAIWFNIVHDVKFILYVLMKKRFNYSNERDLRPFEVLLAIRKGRRVAYIIYNLLRILV